MFICCRFRRVHKEVMAVDMELISVIVPVYNAAAFLDKCIQSIIEQTYSQLEIILVNDGSIDESGDICKKYEKIDKRISVYHQQNRGLSAARNTGIENAKGKYLCFVDADDWLDRKYCEELYHVVKVYHTQIALCDFFKIRSEEEVKQTKKSGRTAEYSQTEILYWLSDWKSQEYARLVVAWNKLYARECFEKLRYPEGKLHEDEFVIHHILEKCPRVAVIEDGLYYYRQHTESIMGRNDFGTNMCHMDSVNALENRIDFYRGSNQQAFLDAFHNYLRMVNSFYEMYRNKKEDVYQKARKQLIKRYRKKYRESKAFFDVEAHFRYGIFYHMPEVYRILCKLR